MVGFREIDIKIKVVTNKVILTRNCFEPFPNWSDTKGFVHIPTAVCILWVDKSTCEVDHVFIPITLGVTLNQGTDFVKNLGNPVLEVPRFLVFIRYR